MSAIVLQRISKRYRDTLALDGVSLSIEPGSFFSLLGPSGCGKSTLLKIIAGLERPSSGELFMDGEAVAKLGPAARNIAMVFQSYALYPHLSARQNIALPLVMRRLARWQRLPLLGRLSPATREIRAAIQAEVQAVAGTLAIQELLERRPGELSGGQKQRVAVGRALVRRPRAFLLDEPLSNLDAMLRVQMRAELVDIHRRFRIPFVYVTHDQSEAMVMSDRIAVLMAGRVVQVGTPPEIYEEPASLAVARFVGTSALNVLAAGVASDGVLGAPFHGLALGGTERPATGRLLVAFRPEQAEPCQPIDGMLTLQVQRLEYHGGSRQLIGVVEGAGEIRVQLPASGPAPRPGEQIPIRLEPARAMLFDAVHESRLAGELVPVDPRRRRVVG